MSSRCRYCKSKFESANSLNRLCSPKCAYAWLMTEEGQKQHRKVKAKLARDKKKARGDAKKGKAHQEQLTQTVFNKMIRMLDEGENCISCGRSKCGTYWDAGHFKSVGAKCELRFDPRNCYLQGSACNRANRRPDKNNNKGLETIAQEYELRLRAKVGDELVDWLQGPHPMPHFTEEELKKLRAVFSAECRRLEKGGGASRDWRSMDYTLRDLIEA